MLRKLILKRNFSHDLRFVHDTKKSVTEVHPSLIDLFHRKHNYLRISVTERCSFRCQYCMPADGVPLTPEPDLLSTKEIIHLSSLFIKMGVNKIRFTGGEPLIRKDIVELIGCLSQNESLLTIAMTTNGLILHRKIKELKNSGLNAINISLDTMVAPKFEFITRRKGLNNVLKSIDAAVATGFSPVKVNCVVMKGFNDDELVDFVKFTEDKNVDVRFIEYCPFAGNKWKYDRMVPYSEMLTIIKKKYPQLQRLPDTTNDTSKAYKVPGFKGQIGFITSMTENFCGSCNRLRLTADGSLKVCLFESGEVSLREALRQNASEEELMKIIGSAVINKKKKHAGFGSRSSSSISSQKTSLFSSVILSLLKNRKHIVPDYVPNRLLHFHQCLNSNNILTHVDGKGEINMVDVSSKSKTSRCAEAEAQIYLGPVAFSLVKENKMIKGDVLSVANIAGIMAAKRTSEFIPLCHSINIDQIKLSFTLLDDEHEVIIKSLVKTIDRTGVEMEALTAATIAALTIYDMCKAVSKDMVIKSVALTLKTGGKKKYEKLNT